jgi:uncharacterized protein YybS (DUF2232 family)
MTNHNKPAPLMLVETAFFASTASLIWLINYYFPLGPVLRLFFTIPISLVYLRWGPRAAWMSALVSGLLLSVLMGPTRSILYVIPYGLLGVHLGYLWRKKAGWFIAIFTGSIIGTIGIFFRLILLSILLGEDLWTYFMTQLTQFLEWVFLNLGILQIPSLWMVQAFAILMLFINSVIYLFVIHLVALLLLDKLGNPIPRPPKWVQVMIEYDYDDVDG